MPDLLGDSLRDRRVLVLRPEGRETRLALEIERLGAHAVCVPAIAFELAQPGDALTRAMERSYDTAVFTSVTGVTMVTTTCGRLPSASRLAAVGPATANALRQSGAAEVWAPSTSSNDALVAELPGPGNVALFRASIADTRMEEALTGRGFAVTRVNVYQTRAINAANIRSEIEHGVDAVVLTSASIARAFASAVADCTRALPSICCIGEPTANACRAAGIDVTRIAQGTASESLVKALMAGIQGGDA